MIGPLRALQAVCFTNEIVSYPYNTNEDVPAFQGLAFTMENQGGEFVEVLTLELDILDEADADLAIELYAYSGDYKSVIDNLDEWEILADTNLVLNPDSSRGAVIPAHDFRPFTVGQGQIMSFYLKMQGPWIDNTLNAFLGDGDAVPSDNSFVTLYPGSGFTESFPQSVDTSIRPIFAGNFHLRAENTCSGPPETKIEFLFVTDMDVTDGVLAAISETIDLTLESLFRVDTVLVGMQNDYDLKQAGSSESTTVELSFLDDCQWDSCTSIESVVTWTHSDELFVDQMKYRMYTHTDTIMKEIRRMYRDNQFSYVGLVATKAAAQFMLKDVQVGLRMDQSQEDHFTKHTLEFINSEAEERTIEALTINLQKKSFVSDETNEENQAESNADDNDTGDGSGRRALQELGEIELLGQIRGIRYSHISENEFALLIQDVFFNPGNVRDYAEKMRFEANYPGPLSEFDRHEFFENLVMVTGKIESGTGGSEEPSQSPTIEESEDDEALKDFINKTIDNVAGWEPIVWIIIGASIFAIILAIATFLVVRCVREEIEAKKRRAERQVDKEFMRQEKRLEEIRRKQMIQQGLEDPNMYSADFEQNANQSFGDDFFEQSQSYLQDSAMFDPQASAGHVGAPHGSRRRFYGPALSNIDMEQPLPGTSMRGHGRMPPSRRSFEDSYGSAGMNYQ